MQRSLVYNAIKPCSRCKETLFATQTNLHRIHLLPIHKFATETIANHSSHPICKDTTFHHPFASFPPTILQSTMPPMHFGCTSGVLPSRSTPDEQPHNSLIPSPKTAAQLPKGVLVYFLFKIIANASRMTNASVLRSLYDPIKAFLCILSSMDDNFASIISFINDKICIFATVYSISTKRI